LPQPIKVNASPLALTLRHAKIARLGVIYTDPRFLDEVKTPCETRMVNVSKMKYLLINLTVNQSEVLAMSVHQALDFSDSKEVVRKLQALHDVGLDYRLGNLCHYLVAECQRIKLASELPTKGSIHVKDEPQQLAGYLCLILLICSAIINHYRYW
jgi:excinuclease UvrABC ATPase subunit